MAEDQTFDERAGSMFDQPDPAGGSPDWMNGTGAPTGIGPGATSALAQPDDTATAYLNDPVMKPLRDERAQIRADERQTGNQMISALRQSEANRPAPPQLEKVPKPPQQNIGQGAMEFLQAATLLGALAGLFARRGTTTSLNAFAGAIKGFSEGNLEVFRAKSEEWKQAVDTVKQNNQEKLDQYDAIMRDKKMSLDQKMEELKIAATMKGDEMTYNLAEQRNYTMWASTNQKEKQAQQKWDQSVEKTNKWLEVQNARIDQMQAANDEAIDAAVDMRLAGNQNAPSRLGRSQATLKKYNERLAAEQKKRGIDGAAQAKIDEQYVGDMAQQRLRGGMMQRVGAATEEVERAIPLALQASRAMPRGQFVPGNKLKQMGQKAFSNPAWNSFLVYNQTLAKAYGRAMNPQGIPRVSEQAEAKAEGFLDMASSPEAYEAQVRALWQEVQNSKAAIAQTREGLTPQMGFPGGGGGAPAPSDSGWKVIQ